MLLIQVTKENIPVIMQATGYLVTEGQLLDQIELKPGQTESSGWFLQSQDLWAFIEGYLLEETLYTVLKLLDS